MSNLVGNHIVGFSTRWLISLPLQFYRAQGRVYTQFQTTLTPSPESSSWNRTVGISVGSPGAGTQPQLGGYRVPPDPGRQRRSGTG